MSAAAPARIRSTRARKVDLWRSGGFTAFQNEWLPHVVAVTNNHTELSILMLILRETEGWAGKKKPKSAGQNEEVAAISFSNFAEWCMRDAESIRIAIKALLARKIIRREPSGPQSYRYFPLIEQWEAIAEREREEWRTEQKSAAAAAAEEEEDDDAEDHPKPAANLPRKFGGFNKAFVAKAGFKSEEAEIPKEARKIAFEVPHGNLIILPAFKDDTLRISIKAAPEEVQPPLEKLGGKSDKSSLLSGSSHNKNSLSVLRELLNRLLRSKLGPVDDRALTGIADLVPEDHFADLAGRVKARYQKIDTWGFVIGLANDVARALARTQRHVEYTDEDLASLEEFNRRHRDEDL